MPTGTYDGLRTITLTYTFYVFAENVSAATIRAGGSSPITVPNVVVKRISH